MWFKDKLVRNIIISVEVIALLAGAYIWVINIPEKAPDTPENETTPTVSVYEMNVGEIEKIHIKNPQAEYTIVQSYSIHIHQSNN